MTLVRYRKRFEFQDIDLVLELNNHHVHRLNILFINVSQGSTALLGLGTRTKHLLEDIQQKSSQLD